LDFRQGSENVRTSDRSPANSDEWHALTSAPQQMNAGAFAPSSAVQMLNDGPRDRQAVVHGRAPADFVEDDQGAVGGVVEDVRGLVHSH
jgi:hypothetical protein